QGEARRATKSMILELAARRKPKKCGAGRSPASDKIYDFGVFGTALPWYLARRRRKKGRSIWEHR
ncbi:hypothetical protein, partial [Acetivibrio ethanolgignens]|uniref:hypothetical protein n=1 Tax=Acetivibrio ethanolgignens TaxID=290052 RepID=UPI00164CEDB8